VTAISRSPLIRVEVPLRLSLFVRGETDLAAGLLPLFEVALRSHANSRAGAGESLPLI
jgi:hypothetical protein